MPTTYDVFAALIEHAPCKAKDLPFDTPVYAHLRTLESEGLIRKTQGSYLPVKTDESQRLFRIIRYCLKSGLDYNVFLSKSMPRVVRELFDHAPDLRPEQLQRNRTSTALMNYLERHQFVLVAKRRPRVGIILEHRLFQHLLGRPVSMIEFMKMQDEVLDIKTDPLNPFDESVFAFLSGSAQLEGSTITAGETRELIMNDIYPDKPGKDIQMVKNLNEAMHYVFGHLSDEMTPEHICELNRLIMFGLHRNAGKYKTSQNRIQGNPSFKTAAPHQVPARMQHYAELLRQVRTRGACAAQLGEIHNELQRIHPFADGNSRTTRMVLNWMLLKHRLPLLIVKMGCFDVYMQLTKLAQRRNDEALTRLFHHLLLHESLIN